MRRLLCVLLVLAFGLPGVTPLLALGRVAESRLPVCCRRGGAHHCLAGQDLDGAAGTTVRAPRERCPYCPAGVIPAGHGDASLVTVGGHGTAAVSRPNGVAQTESRLRVAQVRARQKRGPPTVFFL